MRKVIAQHISEETDMSRFLEHLDMNGEGAVIKPNWTSWDYGFYTDPETLDVLLSQISGKKYVIESYMYGRTDGTIPITAENAKAHWDYLRQQDAYFLEHTGMGKILTKHNAEYINITEEWWSNRTVPASDIRQIVEKHYRPVAHPELYGMIPEKLMQLRHLPLISYAKIKYTVPTVANFSTFSMKNMFGLIPVPHREQYHGADFDTGLSRSIVDILTIYTSLFKVIGMNEGIYHIPVTREEGKNIYSMLWTEYDVIENAGLILGSEDLVTLDAVTNKMVGIDPETRSILKIGGEVFGQWDRNGLNVITDAMYELFRIKE
jgi:uncharacterized protein (DUF362 family)